MKIISKFKDYYDGAKAGFFDDSLVFKRKNEKVDFPTTHNTDMLQYKNILMTDDFHTKDFGKVIHKTGIIGFCGKMYPYYYSEWCENKNPSALSTTHYIRLFERDSENLDELLVGGFDVNAKPMYYRYKDELLTKEAIHSWLTTGLYPRPKQYREESKALTGLFDHLFQELGVVYFHINYWTLSYKKEIEIHPILTDLDFMRQVDPFTAYQEIELFIGNTLNPPANPDVPVGDDKVVSHSKGFNSESFRAEKGGKKLKRKENKERKKNRRLTDDDKEKKEATD